MRRAAIVIIPLALLLLAYLWEPDNKKEAHAVPEPPPPSPTEVTNEIEGVVENGDSLFEIFKKHGLAIPEMIELKKSSKETYDLRKLIPGRRYVIVTDADNNVSSFRYWINEDSFITVRRDGGDFTAKRDEVRYERKLRLLGGKITDNLISALGGSREEILLALNLSDIFAWDIDFNTDLREGDTFAIVVEALYRNGEFVKFGNILSAEFVNDKKAYRSFRYEIDGKGGYYDQDGKSLKKAFLKAPLSFRRISSSYSRGRLHPILRIYRPHNGIDYAAATGTPVSAVGDGTVEFTGRKGQYGRLVILRHANGYKTYYGHLSRMAKGIASGRRVSQGNVIGYVGSTGLATGPHLHYEMRLNGRPVNPIRTRTPRGEPIPKSMMRDFAEKRESMEEKLSLILVPPIYSQQQKAEHGAADTGG